MIAAVVSGLSALVLDHDSRRRPDAGRFLREKKSKKYMGLQDELAVASAGLALSDAKIERFASPERAGLFMAVGYIPFLSRDIEPVLEGSTSPGADGELVFSMERFASEGYLRAHPLLAFRCLPNMPAYHVAANFDVQGPYYVGYPSPGQLYLALEQALLAIDEGRIDIALVGGVAHQRNFLVEHHFGRIDPPVPPDRLRDAGAVIVLERQTHALARGAPVRGRLVELDVRYEPFDPRVALPAYGDSAAGEVETGAAAPLVALAEAPEGTFEHRVRSRDGLVARSTWQWAGPDGQHGMPPSQGAR
jgi:3-oxoacyl-(acyl-carrier-protein) synthase